MIAFHTAICYIDIGSRIAQKDSPVQFRDLQTGIPRFRLTTFIDSCTENLKRERGECKRIGGV